MNSDLYNRLLANRILREVSFDYYLKHRETLKKMEFVEFRDRFDLPASVLNRISFLANKHGFSLQGIKQIKSYPLIKAYVKAELARSIWGQEEFFKIFNPVGNSAFANSLSLFNEAAILAQR